MTDDDIRVLDERIDEFVESGRKGAFEDLMRSIPTRTIGSRHRFLTTSIKKASEAFGLDPDAEPVRSALDHIGKEAERVARLGIDRFLELRSRHTNGTQQCVVATR